MQRQLESTFFLTPLGRRILEMCVSSLWPMMVTYSPLVLAIFPRSPGYRSTLQTTVPSGQAPSGRMLPTATLAFLPA